MNMKLIKELRRERLYSALIIAVGIIAMAIIPDDCTGAVFMLILGFLMWIDAAIRAKKLKAGEK